MTKVSIITVTFNSEQTIEDTVKSVLAQDYKNIEYLIIDGKSSDSTLRILNSYTDKIAKIISENDKGIYDAINKGIDLATGEIICILNSDDMYYDEKVISSVVNEMHIHNADSAYGNLYYVDRINTNKVIRKWISGKYSYGKFLHGWMPPHPAFFIKKKCYVKYGKFNLGLKSSADYELMLRMLHKNKISTCYINKIMVKMRTGGTSNVSLKNRIRGNKEDYEAWRLNGLKPRFYTLIWKPVSKIFQYL